MNKPCFLLLCLVANGLFPVYAITPGQTEKENPMTINMSINQQTYEISLSDTAAVKDFVEQLPLTLNMEELNGNEKFADLAHSLPARQSRPGALHAGDLMLYGHQTLVLFYETFQTSYSYTPIGKVIVPEGLKKAVGDKNIAVHFYRD